MKLKRCPHSLLLYRKDEPVIFRILFVIDRMTSWSNNEFSFMGEYPDYLALCIQF